MHFEIDFCGHENIRSLHTKTIEITKDLELTPSGDCIIGVKSEFGCKEIPTEIKKKLMDSKTNVFCSIIVDGLSFKIRGKGHERLVLSDSDDIVLRKSGYVCPRTLAVFCDKASDDIPRKMVKQLQDPKAKGTLRIEVS